MRLALDEMYSPRIARELRARSHDVVSVKERPELMQSADAELYAAMATEHRTIVTNNAIDFIPLFNEGVVRGKEHCGLLLTSDRSMPRSKETIGRFVAVLDSFLKAQTGKDFSDEIRWLP